MNWILNILSFFIIINSVLSLRPEIKAKIEEFYQYEWIAVQHYSHLQQNFFGMKNDNLCIQYPHMVHELFGKTYTDIVPKVTTEALSGVSVTLDDSTYFHIPAIVECRVQNEGIDVMKYYFMIMYIENDACKFTRIYEIESHDNRRTFMISDVKINREMKKTYGENVNDIERWFFRNLDDSNGLFILCNELKAETEATFNNKPKYNVLRGIIEIEEFYLLLDEYENKVTIPGVFACEIITPSGSTQYLYYVPYRTTKLMIPIFMSKDGIIDGKRVFGIREYLVNKKN